MSEPRPNVEKVRAKELPNYIRAFFNESESSEGTAPMSIQRAESMARNPCAQDDDIGLFAAHVGSKCVGYQGLLPGRRCAIPRIRAASRSVRSADASARAAGTAPG